MRDLFIIPKNRIKITHYYRILLLLAFAFLVVGCSKTKKEEEVAIGEAVDLIFKVEGVDSDISVPNLKSSARNTNYVLLPEEDRPTQETFTKDDMFFAINSDQSADVSGFEDLLKPGTKSVPMKNNTKYRLMVYTTANVLVASVEVTTGQAQHITVTAGTTYKWYAYSYNTSTAIPAPNPVNPVLTTPTSTSLLYASGNITPVATGTVLPITFKHQLTQLRVEVKEKYGFRAILNTTGQMTNANTIKTGTFNILDGTIPANTLISANISTLDFEAEVEDGVTKQVAYKYTADNGMASFGVKLNSLKVQYTASGAPRDVPESGLPDDGYLNFAFGTNPYFKKGYVLKGTLEISFRLPNMRILPFSNGNAGNGYRLAETTHAGKFMRDTRNFGPTSDYVRISSLTIDAPTTATLAHESSVGWTRFKALMTNPATYPDVLIVANWFNYLDDDSWDIVKQYIDRGGNVFYLHDEPDPVYEKYAQRGIGNILGQTVSMSDISESSGVYKFTDTPDGAADLAILNGPFGDVRPYHWGQDRVGTGYVNGYFGNDVIVYSTHSQNYKAPSPAGMSFFRHKTKGFFFVGDGGFYLDYLNSSSKTDYPFRMNTTTNFPILAPYGYRAESGSPTYGQPGTNVHGGYTIANSMMFGNIMSYLLNRAHYHGINRN